MISSISTITLLTYDFIIYLYIAALRERRKKREEEASAGGVSATPIETTTSAATTVPAAAPSPQKIRRTSLVLTDDLALDTDHSSDMQSKQGDVVKPVVDSTTLPTPLPLLPTPPTTSTPSDDLSEQLAYLKQSLQTEQENSYAYQQQIHELNNQLLSHTQTSDQLTHTLTQIKHEYQTNETKQLNQIKELQVQINQLQQAQLLQQQCINTATTNTTNQTDTFITQLKGQISDLSNQILELNDTIEMLTLDKEQLLVEKELYEETILQSTQGAHSNPQLLDINTTNTNNTTANNSTLVNTQSPMKAGLASQQLSEENSKLREALRRLKELSTQEITDLKQQLHDIKREQNDNKQLLNTIATLQEEVIQNKEEITDLRAIVDTSASYESMIEQLTETNLALNTKYTQLQVAYRDAVSEQELMEELDARQRQEMEQMRVDKDRLQVQLVQYENASKGVTDRLEEQRKLEEKYKRYAPTHPPSTILLPIHIHSFILIPLLSSPLSPTHPHVYHSSNTYTD